MSKLHAQIKNIDSVDNLNIVTFDYNSIALKMMSLDLNENVIVGKKVSLNMKPTSVAIGKNFSGMLSYSNHIKAVIDSIENGKLLSSIVLSVNGDDFLESIITVESSKRMDLKVGDKVTAIIKASEISIAEILQ
jgi:molybdopterin-binding protein